MSSLFYKHSTKIQSDIHTAFSWHEREGALQRLTPPWEKVELVEKADGIEVGAKCTLNVGTGFFSIPWQAEHIEYYKDKHFKDIQKTGPFNKWEHSHDFEEADGTTTIQDTVEYKLPLHFISRYIAGGFIRKKLQRMFAYRSNVSKNDLEVITEYKPEPKTIVVSGSSGVVGSALIPYLQTQGHKVIRLVRNEKQLCIGDVCWNPNAGIVEDQFENADAVIHLTGEPIGNERWTDEKKLSIIDSRVKSTSLLAKTIASMKNPPKVFICASAIGYYGDRGSDMLTEESEKGHDFISDVCDRWEQSAKPAEDAGVRVVYLRIGVALSPAGGALEKTYKPASLGLGTVFGRGDQYLSWVAMDDVLYAMTHIMETDSLQGAVNLTAPNPVTWGEYADTLAKVLNRPRFLSIPAWLIKLVYGQMGQEVLLSSANVYPKKLLESGFRFRYPLLIDSLSHLLGRY